MGTTAYYYRVGEDGAWIACTNGVTINAEEVNAVYYFKAVSEGGLESEIVPFAVKLDNKAPTAEITVGQSRWRTFLNNITFGLFFKETTTVSIEAADTGSGVAKIEYYLSDTEADTATIQDWKSYAELLTLQANQKYIVYAKITDSAGNHIIVNSDGVVLFTDSAVDTDKVDFTKQTIADVTIAVSLNGNTVREVLIDGEVLAAENYSVSDGVITLKADWLNTLDAGEYTITVRYYPLGETAEPQQGSDTPAETTINLVVSNALPPTKGVEYTVSSSGWSNTDFVVTAKPGYELSRTGARDGEWTDSITVSEETASGSVTFYVKNKTTGAISAAATETYKIDKTAPAGDIKMGTDSIKNALNAITFGLFFKDTRTISITAEDSGSGVASIGYTLSDTVLDEDAVRAITDWTEYKEPFNIEPDTKAVVYVRITDNAGNTLYIGSNGLVIENTAPVIGGIEDGKAYCSAVTVEITVENLDTVTVNGEVVQLANGKLTLNPIGEQTIVVTDKAGNSATMTVTVYDSHAWDEGVVTEQPTSSRKGVRTYTCAHCGEIRTEEIPMLAPTVIEGQNASYDPNKGGTLTFRSDAAFSDFVAVLVDGIVIDASNYEVREGSIVVTLKADYLATLSAGKHTIGIKSASGIATAEFTVAEKTETQPAAGDSGNTHMWFIFFASGSALTAIGLKRRKLKKLKAVHKT